MASSKEESEGVPLLQEQQQQQQQQAQAQAHHTMMATPEMMATQYGNAAYAWAQYEQGYPDAAAAAAAAAAMHAQPQPPPPYFFPQGYQPQGYQHQQYYPPQAQAPHPGAPFYPHPQYGAPPPAPLSRPPRASRRGSGNLTPSPTGSIKKTYQPEQPQAPPPLTSHVLSSIPPLQDIFSNDQPLLSSISNNNGGGGYGATSNNNSNITGKIWNAPQPPRGPSMKRVQHVLVRTNSSAELNNKNKPNKMHRRANSDTPLRAMHRRMGSGGGADLPPMHRRVGSSSSMRGRAMSEGRSVNVNKPKHRRVDSTGSMHTYSSNLSMGSVVSNIAKSALFGGVDEGGRVQMHFPFEAVRLVMIDPEDPHTNLYRGNLYLDGEQTDFETFEDYHRISENIQEGVQPQWECLEMNNMCGCQCNNCNGCIGKQELLPAPNYLLAVKDDVYKRVLGEIADARTMPCGLFFCGHHEDVAYPSISIAVFLVSIVFLSMAYVAFFYEV